MGERARPHGVESAATKPARLERELTHRKAEARRRTPGRRRREAAPRPGSFAFRPTRRPPARPGPPPPCPLGGHHRFPHRGGPRRRRSRPGRRPRHRRVQRMPLRLGTPMPRNIGPLEHARKRSNTRFVVEFQRPGSNARQIIRGRFFSQIWPAGRGPKKGSKRVPKPSKNAPRIAPASRGALFQGPLKLTIVPLGQK